jgi:hypothetical protein
MTKLPEFAQRCQDFSKASSDINTHRRLNSLTLTRNAQLLEILELPQLMDTCIRNGNYEEALELAAYVRKLGKKHGQIPIIAVSFTSGSVFTDLKLISQQYIIKNFL